jgi:hypothetical protein
MATRGAATRLEEQRGSAGATPQDVKVMRGAGLEKDSSRGRLGMEMEMVEVLFCYWGGGAKHV